MIENYDPENTSTINLTNKAIKHFKNFLLKKEGSIGIRIGLKRNGCSGLSYMNEAVDYTPKNHEKIELDGLTIFVDNEAKAYIQGTTIDFIEKDLGLVQVAYYNPQETARCGCGESFSVKGEQE